MLAVLCLIVLIDMDARLQKLEPAKPKPVVSQLSIHDVNQ